jgi:hypothetical protein
LTGHQQIKTACTKKPKALKHGNACCCYHAVKNLLSTCLLSTNNKIKIYRTTICLLFYKGMTPASLILRKENRLRALRRVRGRSNRRVEKTALCVHDSWAGQVAL